MCGISALFTSNEPFPVGVVRGANDVIRHRGPDGEGFYLLTDGGQSKVAGGEDTPPDTFNSFHPYSPVQHIEAFSDARCLAALGHRRLAIVDLSSAGHQPMCSPDKTIWITYNGEIYNHLEIREELVLLGCLFATNSDTEVIIKAYQTWGVDCLQRFNGMFAFVILDRNRNKIFAARDRFGVKPLYYWRSPQGLLAFASEIKQLTTLPNWEARLNHQRAYDFLNWGLTDHTSETLFCDVLQLRGGEYLDVPLNQASNSPLIPIRWYHLRPSPFSGSFNDAADIFRELLTDAVRLRLRADVPVGSCLSGGLDSSALVCLTHQLLGTKGRQKTFSACSDHARFDERQHIEQVIQKTNVDAHYTYPNVDQLLENYSNILWHQDEPYPTASIYAQWMVFKSVKEQGVKVMLDGQGADEQLAGYQGFFGNALYDLFLKGHWRQILNQTRIIKHKHPHLSPWGFLLNKLTPDPVRQPIRRLLGKSSTRPNWLNTQVLKATDIHPFKNASDKSVIDQSRQQLLHTSLPMLLHFEDRNSMAHSVESRTPFLDYRLVEFNLGLPSHYKINNGWTKHVMREGLKNTLPPPICWRVDKIGFATAEEEWICNERSDAFTKLIEQSISFSKGIFNQNTLPLATSMITGNKPYNSILWRQITFAHWLQLFRVSL